MLIFGSLTLQNPTGGSPGSQLPWHCSSYSLDLHFSSFHTSYSQVTWRVIVLRHMVSYSWASLPSFLAFTKLELLTIRGEEHQGTPLHPYQIISLSVLAAIGAVKRQASGLELHWEPI